MMEYGFHASPMRSILGANEEDRFTEFLAGLLAEPEMLKGFLSISPGVEIPREEIGSLQIDIQVSIEGGRPDLVISGEKTPC